MTSPSTHPKMHVFADLLAAIPEDQVIAVTGAVAVHVDHFSQDSRAVGPHGVFVATRGLAASMADGHAFVPTAVQNQVAVIVSEHAPTGGEADASFAGVWVHVKDGIVALGYLSAAWYGHPGREIAVLATTGTNGKTTTTFLLRSILRAWGKTVGLISTVEIRVDAQRVPTLFTTPPAPEFQRLLAAMCDAGCSHAVVEASSHGLHQHRIAAFPVAVAGFTNLTRDHLDYHVTMEAYEAAKRWLFETLAERACICIDEPAGRRMAAIFSARFLHEDRAAAAPDLAGYATRMLTVSTRGEAADLSAHDVRSDLSGVHATVHGVENFALSTPLIGRHNLENALVAIGMARLVGVPLDVILTALKTATGAPGRLQRVTRADGTGPSCFVDYAHSPDALENVLNALAPIVHAAGGKLICVFGAGGDRDKGKRPHMAAVAARLADQVFATSDNPRTEDPEAILADIVAGFPDGYAFGRIADRRHAIEAAVAAAGPNDAVLIAGKGHEDYQIIGTTKHLFDDVDVARAALDARGEAMP